MERVLNEWRSDNCAPFTSLISTRFKQVNDTLGHTRGDMLLEASPNNCMTLPGR